MIHGCLRPVRRRSRQEEPDRPVRWCASVGRIGNSRAVPKLITTSPMKPLVPRIEVDGFVEKNRRRHRGSLVGRFRFQRRLADTLEGAFVLTFELTHLLDVGVVVRQRSVHLREGQIQLVGHVGRWLSGVDYPRRDVPDADPCTFDPRFTAENVVRPNDVCHAQSESCGGSCINRSTAGTKRVFDDVRWVTGRCRRRGGQTTSSRWLSGLPMSNYASSIVNPWPVPRS